MGPLGGCIGREVVEIEGSRDFRSLVFWGVFGMSVGIAEIFSGTGFILAGSFRLNVNFG